MKKKEIIYKCKKCKTILNKEFSQPYKHLIADFPYRMYLECKKCNDLIFINLPAIVDEIDFSKSNFQ